MTETTITQALAELKTLDKRLEKKRQFIIMNAARLNALRDPLEKQGGSKKVVEQERQAYLDLVERKVKIRQAINDANRETELTIGGVTRSIAGWLIWRREAAEDHRKLLIMLQSEIGRVRREAQGKAYGDEHVEAISHVDEAELAAKIEQHEQITGELDGLLSLKNATVTVEIPD